MRSRNKQDRRGSESGHVSGRFSLFKKNPPPKESDRKTVIS